MDSNIEVFGDAIFAGCHSTKKIHSGSCGDVEWPIRESVVQDYGSPGLEQRRVRIGSSGEGSNRRYGTAVNFERLQFVWAYENLI